MTVFRARESALCTLIMPWAASVAGIGFSAWWFLCLTAFGSQALPMQNMSDPYGFPSSP